MSREAIYEALFQKVSGAAPFKTKSRRFRPFTEMAPADTPALFQVQASQAPNQQRQRPPIWTLRADLFVYSWSPDPNVVPTTLLNELVDAIETALRPSAIDAVQTLGGLVSHCWIDGDIDVYEGTVAEWAIAVIPITMLLGGTP